ncbi:M55 family metallopeptidase [Paenibacillus ginsengarvi]|uniref:Peptidase M55 n=1 Tax=Paenibacillus ginsengarvi TaxID=400777 RepID=A0A3B0C9B5_9BACL|nr:M55 family metallopeptidase [Paenibacillus ginsengarvi]RKN82030.1 peptidase M55 [Paenibacillus ginsengarvi]
MKFFIITDLEGVAGTDSFTQTRTNDVLAKQASMKQLAREVNGCVEGIRSVYPEAVVDVLDGHGSGGLFPEDLVNCSYLDTKEGRRPHHRLDGYSALLFVGQHAMAGTIDAPLCHTYSSVEVMYYRLNGVFVGEFATHALQAGVWSVPTIFLAGDDKAALEAKLFVPEIETVVTKYGKGLESADHLSLDESVERIREGAARAVRRMERIPPFDRLRAPYVFEARYYKPFSEEWLARKRPDAVLIDERTYRIETDDLFQLPF